MALAIVLIHGGTFCHGDEVASAVADRLNLTPIDTSLLEQTSQRFGATPEKLSRALTGPAPIFNRLTREREKNIAFLRTTLAEMLLRDNLLLTGCAGYLVPRTIAHALQVCVIANMDYRIAQAARESGKSEQAARKTIKEDDERLTECASYLFDRSPFDSKLYDIVVPMHSNSVEDAVALISEQAQGPAVQTTERSRRAAEDFVLSSRVQLALVEAGLKADVHAEQGNVVLLLNEYVVRQSKYEEQLTKAARSVDGVNEVTVRLGPDYAPPSMNPWSDVGSPPKFLLVDDEREFVETLSERLQTRDLESAIAYDGEQALDMLKSDSPDVMVLDLMMPGIDGIEVLRRVKKDHPDVEVIILTGHGSDSEREQAEELGAFAYLQKPANIDELAKVMKEAYARVNSRRKN
ncbi:response regulator [bacterium]|nr:response regulator [bacterium]